MGNYIIRRLLESILVLIGVTLVTFVITRATGDPASLLLPENTPQEAVDAFRKFHGLDQPLHIQYIDFIGSLLLGDLGTSIRFGTSVTNLVLERFPATLQLTLTAMVISMILAFPIGTFVATRRNSIWDLLGTSYALLGQAAPSFWIGLMLILIFGVRLQILPISGSDSLKHLILPAFTLGFYLTGRLTRLVRSSMLEVLGRDYIRTARAKGLFENVVIWKHALKNAAIPVVTLLGLELAGLLSGAMIIETVFAWPGIGRLVISAILQRDFPIVQGVVIFSAFLFVFINLSVDILYSLLDPRISYQ